MPLTLASPAFRHRAACNIPPDWRALAAGHDPETQEPGFMQAVNDFREPGHGGPCPPAGDRPHGYHFRLGALSGRIISAVPRADCAEIRRAARPMELGFVELVGFHDR